MFESCKYGLAKLQEVKSERKIIADLLLLNPTSDPPSSESQSQRALHLEGTCSVRHTNIKYSYNGRIKIHFRQWSALKSSRKNKSNLLEITMASLNSLRQFCLSAVRPPLVMTALVPCSWWKRRSLAAVAPEIEHGLPGDIAVGPSELSSGRGGRSAEERKTEAKKYSIKSISTTLLTVFTPFIFLTHIIHDGGLGSLSIQVHHCIHAGRNVPGRGTLRHSVHKEMQAPILLTDNSNCISGLWWLTQWGRE